MTDIAKITRKSRQRILGVELASPEKIRKWAERLLPTGKIVGAVLNANTIHHKTLKPIKGGLFCERIFGPTKDFRCACGKSITKQNALQNSNDRTYINKALFCKICEVEYTSSLLRRYQLGYIPLAFPVTHLWYTKGFSNPISLLLDIHKYDLDCIIYCNKITSIEKSVEITDMPVGKDPIELLERIQKSKKKTTNTRRAARDPLGQGPYGSNRKKAVDHLSFPIVSSGSLPHFLTRRVPSGAPRATGIKYWKVEEFSLNSPSYRDFPSRHAARTKILKKLSDASSYGSEKQHTSFSRHIKYKTNTQTTLQKLVENMLLESGQTNISLARRAKRVSQRLATVRAFSDSPGKSLEREYLKSFIQLRKTLSVLPKQSLSHLNKQFYKQLYRLLNQLTSQYVKTNGARFSRVDKNYRGIALYPSSRPKQYVEYLFREVRNRIDLSDRISSPLETSHFGRILVSFLFHSLKRNRKYLFGDREQYNLSPKGTARDSTSQKGHAVRATTLSPRGKRRVYDPLSPGGKGVAKPSGALRFVYNIYAIADDHLWANLEDWNLLKSYITVAPSIVDALIPFYSQRITLPTFTNPQLSSFNPIQAIYDYTRGEDTLGFLPNSPTLRNLANKGFSLSDHAVRATLLPPGLSGQRTHRHSGSSYGVGAGILNLFFTSLTPTELNAMDKQLSQLLRESRMNILLYKTKQIRTPKNGFSSGAVKAAFALRAKGMLSTAKTTYWRPSVEICYSRIDIWMEKHHEILRRSKTIRKFSLAKILPEFMVLKMLPVLPPELRPIRKGNDGDILTSDLNRLYQRVLFRNERLNNIVLPYASVAHSALRDSPQHKESGTIDGESENRKTFRAQNPNKNRASESLAPLFGYEKHYTQRLLQEATDNLIDNGRSGGTSEVDAKGRILKSLSEVLKGKQGRFRQYLLGKRVDYSGRSVIVVGPKLKIHQCGLPREMALELYLPFIIQYLIQMKYTRTVVGAKSLIAQQPALVATVLDEIVQGHPIVLNRAPTLHRLGFQAFQPLLVDGRAILLHPMACTAFNADFDGDQMAVHIPITVEARSEAWRLMLARNNLLSPATGEPIILPSQDMILGCYYLTTLKKMPSMPEPLFATRAKAWSYYTSIHSVLNHYSLGKLHIHTPIWLKTKKTVYTETSKKPYEIRISYYGKIEEITKNCIYHSNDKSSPIESVDSKYIRTTAGRILFNSILTRAYIITADGSDNRNFYHTLWAK